LFEVVGSRASTRCASTQLRNYIMNPNLGPYGAVDDATLMKDQSLFLVIDGSKMDYFCFRGY